MKEDGGNLPKDPELGLLTRDERLRRGIIWVIAETGVTIPKNYLPDYERAAEETCAAEGDGFVRVIPFPEEYQIADDGQPLDSRVVKIALPGRWLDEQGDLGPFWAALAEARADKDEARIGL